MNLVCVPLCTVGEVCELTHRCTLFGEAGSEVGLDSPAPGGVEVGVASAPASTRISAAPLATTRGCASGFRRCRRRRVGREAALPGADRWRHRPPQLPATDRGQPSSLTRPAVSRTTPATRSGTTMPSCGLHKSRLRFAGRRAAEIWLSCGQDRHEEVRLTT